MPDLVQQIESLRKRAEDCRAAKARAEHQQATAAAQYDLVAAELQAEFGIAPEQAPQLLEQLEAELAAEAQAIERALAVVEGTA